MQSFNEDLKTQILTTA